MSYEHTGITWTGDRTIFKTETHPDEEIILSLNEGKPTYLIVDTYDEDGWFAVDGWDEVERIAFSLLEAKVESSEGLMAYAGVMDIYHAFRLLKRGCSIRRLAWTEGAWLIPITVPPGTIDGDYAMRCPSGEVEDYRLTIEDITSDDWVEVD